MNKSQLFACLFGLWIFLLVPPRGAIFPIHHVWPYHTNQRIVMKTSHPHLLRHAHPHPHPHHPLQLVLGGMASFVDPLVVGRVIGEVVDLFVPTVSMLVHYGSKHVNNGCNVKPSMALEPPTIQISGRHNDLFTLVMTDPDAPSPSDPTMREWVHWVVVNIPGGTNPTKGDELLAYMAPRPPLGIHRYVFVLFQQKAPFPSVALPATRAHFNTRMFAARFDLGLPVATVYFNSQKEPTSRRR